MPFAHTTRIRLARTDAAGVVYFAHVLDIAHEAYEAMLDDAGCAVKDILAAGEYAVPVVEANAQIVGPLRLGDDVTTALVAEKIGTSSFVLAGTLTVAGQVVARTRTVHVSIRPPSTPIPLPERLRAAVTALHHAEGAR